MRHSFNHRNLFVLDEAAINETIKRGVLTFSGYYQEPQLIDEEIHSNWTSKFVALSDATFPNDTLRPYFFDYDAERRAIEKTRVEALQHRQREVWTNGLQDYLDAALLYYESDYDVDMKAKLLAKVDELLKSRQWDYGLDLLRDEEFYRWHAVLPVLLSIKLNRPVGYSKKLTVFQVVEAGLRTSHRNIGKHAFAILYLWACKAYKPTMTKKNHTWIGEFASKVKQSIDIGDTTYRRFSGYDPAICLLFPQLKKDLDSAFGITEEVEQ